MKEYAPLFIVLFLFLLISSCGYLSWWWRNRLALRLEKAYKHLNAQIMGATNATDVLQMSACQAHSEMFREWLEELENEDGNIAQFVKRTAMNRPIGEVEVVSALYSHYASGRGVYGRRRA